MKPEITPDYLAAQGLIANLAPAYLAAHELSGTILDRFLPKAYLTSPEDDWIWTATLWHGYGQMHRGITRSVRAQIIAAHLVSFILFNGPIPKGQLVLHKCPGGHRRDCVNPRHLELGDKSENGRDSIEQGTNAFFHIAKHVKLTQELANEIRSKWIGHKGQQTELAKEYGVSRHTISLIIRNVTWWDETAVPFHFPPGNAKLTWEQVHIIRRTPLAYGEHQKLALRFGITATHLSEILHNKAWPETAQG